MLKVIMPVGIPGSGKSTWAKAEIAKDPENWARVNNDDIRAMLNGSNWSSDYEKFVTEARNFLIREALKRNKNVIVDNLNLSRRHFNDVCEIAKKLNKDIQVLEKLFYIELDEAIERDSKREGKAKVGEDVIKKWWKESGGKQHKFYKPRVEVFLKQQGSVTEVAPTVEYDPNLEDAIICDLDGTLALIHNRNPYDASECDIKDLPNPPVIETVLAHYQAGRKIIFCSGREDKFREQTVRFIEKYVREKVIRIQESDPNDKVIPYELFMRATSDTRKDSIIKEEIYNEHIKGKYNVLLVLDDRNQVVDLWRSLGLTCFQVAPGNF